MYIYICIYIYLYIYICNIQYEIDGVIIDLGETQQVQGN